MKVQVLETKQNLFGVQGHNVFVQGEILVVAFQSAVGAVLKQHTQVVVFSLGAQVLHNIRVIQVLKQIYFCLKGTNL